MERKTLHIGLLSTYLVVFVWSLIHPVDWVVWGLEIGPVLIGVAVLLWTYSSFPLSTLSYVMLWVVAIVMTVGGHYSYQMVPLFNWIRDVFHLKRNDYDRLGHFLQGMAVAVLVREILLRRTPLLPGKWLFFLVLCTCMAFSNFYELVEFISTKLLRGSIELFLGIQGDIWDPQWDMFSGLLGALTALLLFSKYQNRHVWEAEAQNWH